jgi:hypothetical protein
VKDVPESWISQTLVTAGRVVFLAPPVFVGAGVDGDGELGVGEVEFEDVWCAGVFLLAGALGVAVAGVAWGLTGGGCTGAVLACAAAWLCARAASEAINRGSRPLAREAWGAGPIAAPTATPITSIVAASAALARVEGSRRTRGCACAAGGSPGESGVWGVSVIVGCGVQRLRRLKDAAPNLFAH